MVVVGLLMNRAAFPAGLHRNLIGSNVGRARWRLIASSSGLTPSSSSTSTASATTTTTTSSSSIFSFKQRFNALKTRAKSRWPGANPALSAAGVNQCRRASVASNASEAGGDGGGRNNLGGSRQQQQKKRRRWVPLSVIFANLVGFFLWSQYHSSDVLIEDDDDVKAVAIGFWHKCVMALPWRYLSRSWGYIHSLELPEFLRPVFIGAYARVTGCNLDEAEDPNLRHYRNIGEFFRRSLKPGIRPIDEAAPIVSPADGRVVACGRVCDDRIDEVKGITYSMAKFLGPKTWECGNAITGSGDDHHKLSAKNYGKQLLNKCDDHALFECVIYLAPGDYHRFHSPASWSIHHRRHFPGDLLSVHPAVAAWFPNLFAINERAAYYGDWEHGFFAVGVVGATNVGSIKIPFDTALATNMKKFVRNSWFDLKFEKPITQCKGAYFGEFNMGSTLVLIFEAPRNSQFTVRTGDRVRVGQRLLDISC